MEYKINLNQNNEEENNVEDEKENNLENENNIKFPNSKNKIIHEIKEV